MLNLLPAPPPRPCLASLCREFGRQFAQLTRDTIRFGLAGAVVWLICTLLGVHL